MKKLIISALLFLMCSGAFSQKSVSYTAYKYAGYRTVLTHWEWKRITLEGDLFVKLHFDANGKIDIITINNKSDDRFLISTDWYANEQGGRCANAIDRKGKVVAVELIKRNADNITYYEIYVRYQNIEYNYKFN